MACTLSPEQLTGHSDRVTCSVDDLHKKFLPSTSKCTYVDPGSRDEIRLQLGKFPHLRISANPTSHIDRSLCVEFKLSNLTAGGEASRARDSSPAVGAALSATLPQHFRLASAEFGDGSGYSLTVDGDSIFGNTTGKPSPVSLIVSPEHHTHTTHGHTPYTRHTRTTLMLACTL